MSLILFEVIGAVKTKAKLLPDSNATFMFHFANVYFFDFCFKVNAFFKDRVFCSFAACLGTSSCRPGWPQTHRDLPTSASQVLGLKVCTSTARLAAEF